MPRRRFYAGKHAFDRVTAALFLILLSPLLVLIALLVLLVEGTPVFFRQERPGLHGRPFTILKFRTMRDTEGEDADRLTWLGRILRATSLDELPELINVLRGEMSLVGPRPLLMRYLPRYTPQQMRRHEVRPGMTGLAQVNGRNELDWESRFELDVWYVDHGSFWLDIRILALTLVKVVMREGLSAPGHATMPEFMGSPIYRPAGGALPERVKRTLRLSGRVLACAAALQFSASACVAVIDPYGVTSLVRIDGLNDDKTRRMGDGGRVERSIRLWQSDFDTLILGGSRAWVGIDPAGPMLRDAHAYNAAVPEAAITEVIAIGRFALQQQRPRRVIISLSLSMFEEDRRPARDFDKSGFDGDPMPLVIARSMMEPAAVRDAIETVRDNLRGTRASDLPNGLHVRLHPDENYRRAFDQVLTREYLVKPYHYARFEYDARRVGALRQLIADFVRSGADVYVFVAPVHSRQLEAMAAMGVYPIFERWLVDLTSAVAQVRREQPAGGDVALWDFTGYNPITAEDIPDPGDPQREMRWYWNSSLHTPALGEMVMARMFGRPCTCPDFGARLEPDTVAAVLAKKLAGRARYTKAHPYEVAEIQRLIRQTEPMRRAMIHQFEDVSGLSRRDATS